MITCVLCCCHEEWKPDENERNNERAELRGIVGLHNYADDHCAHNTKSAPVRGKYADDDVSCQLLLLCVSAVDCSKCEERKNGRYLFDTYNILHSTAHTANLHCAVNPHVDRVVLALGSRRLRWNCC